MIDSKPKPQSKSRVPRISQSRIVIENVYESRAEPNEAAQMSLLFFTTRPFWARASKIAIAHFNSLAQGSSRARHFHDKEVISNSEAWLVKVVCTLFVRSNSMDTCFGYVSKNLSPTIAFEVIRRLNNPKLGLKFFELSRVNLSLNHSYKTYNLLMRSLCQMGLHDSARFVFDCMRNDGLSPDNAVIEFLVSSFAQIGRFDVGEKLLDELKRDKIRLTAVVYDGLLSVLLKRNQVGDAVSLFRKHSISHFRPNQWTFNILIRGLCGVGDFQTAFEVLSDMEKFSCSPDIVTFNTLINGLCRNNEVDRGRDLLRNLQAGSKPRPGVIAFTSVISGYCKSGRMEEASFLFDEMISFGVKPNEFTFNALIDGFVKISDMVSAVALYEKMMFHGYCPDVVTFTSLMDGYCRAGQLNQSLELWGEMNARKVMPNGYTFSVIIQALCRDNRLQEARDFVRQLNCSNIVPKAFMYNPVIDGFCKAGNVDEANVIVAEMEAKRCKPDRHTFTILILGNCMKGRMSEAIGVFNNMLSIGCAPDRITVNGLITCLRKAGMPNEVRYIEKIVFKDLNLDNLCSRSVHLGEKAEIPVAA